MHKAREEALKVPKKRDEFQLKWEQADGDEEDWSTSAKKPIDETHGRLAQARDTILQMKQDNEEQLAVVKGHSNYLKAPVTDRTGQMVRVEELLPTSGSNEGTAFAEVKTLHVQGRYALGHVRTFRSKMPGFQARLAEEVKDGVYKFCRRLANTLSDLAGARRCGIGGYWWCPRLVYCSALRSSSGF